MISKLSLFLGLLKLQSDDWSNKICYELRFLLCGVSSFFTYSIYKLVGTVGIEQQNFLIAEIFGNPVALVSIFYIVFLSYVGLYFSIISVALFNTLLPKT